MSNVVTSETPAVASSDPRWQLAQRVAESSNLRNCPKLRGFLLYVCEHTILGQTENVREQLIGARVFGRATDYNISDDNIVRVEARELRKRLSAYFAGEGANEPAIIEIPKGAYVPVFRPRHQEPVAPIVHTTALITASAPLRHRIPFRRWMPVIVLVVTAVLLLSAMHWWAPAGAAGAAEYGIYNDLLGSLAQTPPNPEILLVLSNPKVILYYGADSSTPPPTGAGLTIPAPAELKQSFSGALNNLDVGARYQFLHSTREDYTGMGEATGAFHMGRLLQTLHRPVRLTQGRFLSWDQVQKQNLILLGAPHINDWTYHNVRISNFEITATGIVNDKPLPGERALYADQAESPEPGAAMTAYGVIEMLTSRYGYNMLLIAGTTSASTGGAADFFTNPAKMKPVYDRIRAAAPGRTFPSSWEVLIRVDVRDGIPVDTTPVAVRPFKRSS